MKIQLSLSSLAMAIASARPLGPTVMLRGGVEMPTVSLGSSGGCHPDPDGTEASCSIYNATLLAVKNGYRGFHDALDYCNQAGLGAALKDSGVDRKQLFVMSMVPVYLMGYNETYAAVKTSLAQLQVDSIDLMMVHHRAADCHEWPEKVSSMKDYPDNWAYPGSPTNALGSAQWLPPVCALQDSSWLLCQDETWRALTELKAAGKLRAIGVSNWMVSNLKRMKALGQELPAVNQVEVHVGWADQELLDWSAENGVVTQAATPLARSHPIIVKPGANPVVTALATKYGKQPAQICLRFLVDKGVAMIPNSAVSEYQQQNLAIFDFQLEPNELIALANIAFPCQSEGNPTTSYKCWQDPASVMCLNSTTGAMYHCP